MQCYIPKSQNVFTVAQCILQIWIKELMQPIFFLFYNALLFGLVVKLNNIKIEEGKSWAASLGYEFS